MSQYQKGDSIKTQSWSYNTVQNKEGIYLILPSGYCSYGKCLGCNFPTSPEGFNTSPEELKDRLNNTLANIENPDDIQEVILSNNASLLDKKHFPFDVVLHATTAFAKKFPNMKTLSFETRPQFVEDEDLAKIQETLKENGSNAIVEIAVGVEIFDEHVRNKVYKKGISNTILEKVNTKLAKAGGSLRTYFMYKPVPGWSNEQASEDIKGAVGFLSKLSNQHAETYKRYHGKDFPRKSATLHLNPTFVAAGSRLENEFANGNYTIPKMIEVENCLLAIPKESAKDINFYVALCDEGIAVEGGSPYSKSEGKPSISSLVEKRVDQFNKTNNFDVLGEKRKQGISLDKITFVKHNKER